MWLSGAWMKADEALVEDPGHDEAQDQKDERADDALAQLVQMLHQAHAGQLRALGHGLARLADGLRGINHARLPGDLRVFFAVAGALVAAGLLLAAWDGFLCRRSLGLRWPLARPRSRNRLAGGGRENARIGLF